MESFQIHQPPILPKSRSRIFFYSIIAIVLVVISIFIYFFLYRQTPSSNLVVSKPADSFPPAEDLKKVKDTMFPQAKLSFPEITSATPSSMQDIPSQLSALLAPGFTNGSFDNVVFANGKKGFVIKYIVDNKMSDVYKSQFTQFLNNKDWPFENAMTARTFALIELENSTYQAHLEHTWTADGKDQVVVTVIPK